MATAMEAKQLHLALKMKYAVYSWYSSCGIMPGDGDYCVVIYVKRLDNQIRKLIPPVINDISVKTEVV